MYRAEKRAISILAALREQVREGSSLFNSPSPQASESTQIPDSPDSAIAGLLRQKIRLGEQASVSGESGGHQRLRERVTTLGRVKGSSSVPSFHHSDEPSSGLRQLLHELRSPVSALIEARLVSVSPDMTVEDAVQYLNAERVRLAIVQENRDMILGVVSLSALEQALEDSKGDTKRSLDGPPRVTMFMGRNISIETSSATILEVLERMTVGSCPFVVIVNEFGHPFSVLDPIQVLSALSGKEELTVIHSAESAVSKSGAVVDKRLKSANS